MTTNQTDDGRPEMCGVCAQPITDTDRHDDCCRHLENLGYSITDARRLAIGVDVY